MAGKMKMNRFMRWIGDFQRKNNEDLVKKTGETILEEGIGQRRNGWEKIKESCGVNENVVRHKEEHREGMNTCCRLAATCVGRRQ